MKKVIESAKKFNSEMRKTINTSIITALGLIIAFVWKDVVQEFMDKITSLSPVQGKIISALIVTAIAVIAIMIITKTSPSDDDKKDAI
jgi:hypothetical protein